MRDPEKLREYTAMLRSERFEDELRRLHVSAEAFAGYLDILDGRKEAGIARAERALEASRRTRSAPGARAVLARVLLEACMAAGDARMGLAVADDALAMGSAGLWEAEIRRLRAEFLTALGASSQDVEAELACALKVARGQGAKPFELRAALSLLRHRLERGDGPGASEAHDLLAAVLDAFPEGRDTPDLREATSLLA
jgi:hypothetical protein